MWTFQVALAPVASSRRQMAPRCSGGNMRAVVTCECCGNRQAVARQIVQAESFHVMCHSCESVLRVDVTAEELRAAQASAQPGRPPARV